MPLSFVAGFIASVDVAAVDEELGVEELDDVELGVLDDDELGAMELGVDELDEAVELGVVVSVVDDELLVAGGVAGIDGVVELDELLVAGGVVTGVSTFCWQPVTATSTAAAAAVIMNRFIMAPFFAK